MRDADRTVFVGHIHTEALDSDDIQKYFCDFGSCLCSNIRKSNGGPRYCFVTFHAEDAARKVLKQNSGRHNVNGHGLRVIAYNMNATSRGTTRTETSVHSAVTAESLDASMNAYFANR